MSENQGCVLCGITGNLNPISELLLEIFGPNIEYLFGDRCVCFTCMDILVIIKDMQRHLLSIICDNRSYQRKLLTRPHEWDNLLTNIHRNIRNGDAQFDRMPCDDLDTSDSEYEKVHELHRDDDDVEVAELTARTRARRHATRGKKRGWGWARTKKRGINSRPKTAMAQRRSETVQALSQNRSQSVQPQTFPCDTCTSIFYDKAVFDNHLLTHFMQPCTACGRVFNSLKRLQKHQQDHEVWQIRCKYCTMQFTCHKILSHIKNHIEKHDLPLVTRPKPQSNNTKQYQHLIMLQKPTVLQS